MNLIFRTLFLVCLLPFVHPGPINVKDDPIQYKLPDGLAPVNYDLTIVVDLDVVPNSDASYKGQVVIWLDVTADDLKEIKLHSHDNIKITTSKLVDIAHQETNLLDEAVGPQHDPATDILTLKLKDDTKLDQSNDGYQLTLDFEAAYSNDMYGFYKSSYVDKDGNKHWLVTTQFESIFARKAFPCFDEPKFKALYNTKVEVGKKWVEQGYRALSNTPSDGGQKMNGDNYVFTFEPTPEKLASYLVAFIVSDFKKSESEAQFNNGKPFLTWGQDRYISNKEDALSQTTGPAVLDIYSEKFGIPFAYPKIDQVGIPDFNAGAMENWGLTTYRERMLFFNEESNSEATKQSTVAVTAHELAHQWFGDLVTLHAWDDLWLNEGFADYFEYHGSALINVSGLDTSSWNFLGQFVVDEIQSTAFEIDGLESARPLTYAVEKPDEIEGIFDSIAYSKGASVIRMWQHALTEEIFYQGLHEYLLQWKGGSGTPQGLFEGFQAAVDKAEPAAKPNLNGKKVQELFQNWLDTEGYPVIMVQHVVNTTFNFTQERFLWKIEESEKDKTYKWDIPISYSTDEEIQFENTAAYDWLGKDDVVKEIAVGDPNAEKPTWIIINNREAGYYRVNYEEDNWNALKDQLNNNFTVIDEINRAQILDDALSLARSTKYNESEGFISYEIALELTKYLSQEDKYVPWAAASNSFSFLNTKLTSDSNYGFFKTHVLNAVKARYDLLGLQVKEEDSHLDRLLRILIANWACKLGHEKCIADASSQFKDGKVSPDVKSIVYCTAVRNDADAWEKVWNEYTSTDNNLDQTIFLSAFGCSKDPAKLQEYLEETLNTTGGRIKKQDLQTAFMSVYNGNPENVPVALKFLNESFIDIQKTYGGTDPIGKLLIGLAGKAVTSEDINTLKEILDTISADPDNSKLDKSVKLAMDTLKSTEHWFDLKTTTISNWLKKTYGSDDGGDGGDGGGGGGGAAEITVSILTVISCLALLFSS